MLRSELQAHRGSILVVDAVTATDLATLVAAADSLTDPIWVGAGGLARALAGRQPRHQEPLAALPGHALIVVGSTTAVATKQMSVCLQQGRIVSQPVTGSELFADSAVIPGAVAERLAMALARSDVIVSVKPELPARRSEVASRLADVIAPVIASHPLTYLIGGETAGHCLGATSTTSLRVLLSLDTGTVVTERHVGARSDGYVLIKPGAFGPQDSIIRDLAAIRGERVVT
jgi:uncharacterized protein YgbK (DUF1537 family)